MQCCEQLLLVCLPWYLVNLYLKADALSITGLSILLFSSGTLLVPPVDYGNDDTGEQLFVHVSPYEIWHFLYRSGVCLLYVCISSPQTIPALQ